MDGKVRKLCRQKCIKPLNSWKFGVKRALLGQIHNAIKYLYNIQAITGQNYGEMTMFVLFTFSAKILAENPKKWQ